MSFVIRCGEGEGEGEGDGDGVGTGVAVGVWASDEMGRFEAASPTTPSAGSILTKERRFSAPSASVAVFLTLGFAGRAFFVFIVVS